MKAAYDGLTSLPRRDPREAVRIARLCKNKEEVDDFVEVIKGRMGT